MAITPRQLDLQGAYIQDAYMALEEEIMNRLIKRLNAKTAVELTTDTVLQWQMEKLQQLGMLNTKTIDELVTSTAKLTRKQLEYIVLNQGYQIADEANKEFANLTNVPTKEWTNIDQILNSYLESQWLNLDNHVNQTLVTTNYQNNPIFRAYQQVLNDTVAKVLTGFTTPQKAFREAVYNMAQTGLTVMYDRAGRPWSMERYVRTVIKSTTQNVYNNLRLERSNDYGIVTALMSSHFAAREACSHIQGGWVLTVRKEDAPQELQHIKSIYDYGYGTPEGTRGVNCSHRFYPAIYGVNENNMPKPPSPETAQKNAAIVAKQRRLEVSIRDAKKKLNAAKQLGNKQDIEHFNQLVRKRQAAIREFIKDNDILHRSYDREAVYS